MSADTLRIMPREMRMMSERIFSLTALPKGFALMLGDIPMYSQAMGLGGFAHFLNRAYSLMDADAGRLALRGGTLDGGGQHAWVVIPSLLDLLEEQLATADVSELEVIAADPAELQVAAGLGRRAGLEVWFDGAHVRARRVAPADPVLDRVMRQGCDIPATTWWAIYALAQTALTPDSPVSRRHAGVNIVTEDGRIIGRTDNDDDSDTSFIAQVERRAGITATGGTSS